MGVVVVSTLVFVLSTMPELTDDFELLLSNSTQPQVVNRDQQYGAVLIYSGTLGEWNHCHQCY